MGVKNIIGELQVNGSPVVTEETLLELDIKGGSSVYIGSEEPDENYNIWINPDGEAADVGIPTKLSELTNDTDFITKKDIPTASGTVAGITIVYPEKSCTTFTSDSGTVTPLAVQKAAKMFAITRPSATTSSAITRYSNTTGDVQNSRVIIEDVTNTKDSSKKAQVISIPAEGGKKMVYGYCTDQVDGTSFIGGLFSSSATSYPYSAGLAIGGSSGNLLWKGEKVATATEVTSAINAALSQAKTSGEFSYVLTEADKEDIANLVIAKLNATT